MSLPAAYITVRMICILLHVHGDPYNRLICSLSKILIIEHHVWHFNILPRRLRRRPHHRLPFCPDALHLVPTPLAQKAPPDVTLVQRMLVMILLLLYDMKRCNASFSDS